MPHDPEFGLPLLLMSLLAVAAQGSTPSGVRAHGCHFAGEASGLGLARLAAADGSRDIVRSDDPKPLLWRIELRAEDKALKPITLDNRAPAKCSARATERKVDLRWDAIALDGEPDALSVRVTVEFTAPTESAWRLQVRNRSKRYGVWDAVFPILSKVGPDGPPAVAVPRGNWGMLYRECRERQGGWYPSYEWPMQFLCVNLGDAGLYLGCHDPGAWPKRFSLAPPGEFHFRIHAPNQGVAGSGYDQPFPIVLATYSGDWWRGAKLYRAWATRNAPWAAKGPTAERRDVPKKLLGLGLWMLGGGHARESVPKMHEAAKLFDAPIGIHWYNWHEIPFDTYYPNYFPTKPGFADGVKDLVGKGMVVMPYINGRLWDSGNENFAEALPFACKTPDGKPYLEQYAKDGRKLAVMCPFTRFWQDKVYDICRRLITECGVNAIYIDQIAAAGPQLCYDKSHGHPVGGGSWWVDGYRTMLTRIRRLAHSRGRDVILTTENNAEPYMDNVDAFLVWNPRFDNEIPMVSAVYSDHTTYFSSPSNVGDSLPAFAMSQGRDFLFGCQLGWMGFELLDPKNRAKAEYLRDLGKHRIAAARFMALGELLGELRPEAPVPSVEATWGRGWGAKGAHKAVLPAVMATVWRSPEGELCVAATNWSDEPQAFRFRLDPDAWGGIRPGRRKPSHLAITRLAPGSDTDQGRVPYGPIERTETLASRGVLLLEFKPAAGRQGR